MKREAQPPLSPTGEQNLARYEHHLRVEEDLAEATTRNYLSDLRQFAGWCEAVWASGREEVLPFCPAMVTTPTLTEYRRYLQHVLLLKPNSVNRAIVRLKRYFAWAVHIGCINTDPAKVVKLVGEEVVAPRHLDDQEEQALVAAVTQTGSLRDRAIIVLLLHTGLRAHELCSLTRAQIIIGKKSGAITVFGKRNKRREVPLNATARAALLAYDPTLQKPSLQRTPLFLSKTRAPLTERGLGYLVKKYAERASILDISPHDLRHRSGYQMAKSVPLHRLAQIMGHDSLDTTLVYIQGTKADLQGEVEKIAWI